MKTTETTQTDYCAVLREHLERRCKRNPRYSLRAFAKDLGMAPARLSDILRGRYGLSAEAAKKIAARLGLSLQEQEHFTDLVESRHARSKIRRRMATTRLTHRENPFHSLTLDSFKVISDWYHFAILELTALDEFDSDPEWIAKALGISIHEVNPAIERLKRLELLAEVDGKLQSAEPFTASPSGIPSDAIRKFHEQILAKATQAIHLQDVERRDLSAITFAVNREKIPEAKKAIKEFRYKLCQELGAGPGKNDVYCLAIQLFSLKETL